MSQTEFAQWLQSNFVDWMAQSRRYRTQREFAETLGINVSVVNRYMNGKQLPTEENISKLAEKLGAEVYDLLGLARPDPLIQELTVLVGKMSLPQKEKLLAYARAVSQESENA